jgi:hypothetical protein
MINMKWYHYVTAFFAGMFLANAVPHFVNGVSGNPFPSPIAHPPGKGLSVPIVKVLWGLFNIIIGYLLLGTANEFSKQNVCTCFLFRDCGYQYHA